MHGIYEGGVDKSSSRIVCKATGLMYGCTGANMPACSRAPLHRQRPVLSHQPARSNTGASFQLLTSARPGAGEVQPCAAAPADMMDRSSARSRRRCDASIYTKRYQPCNQQSLTILTSQAITMPFESSKLLHDLFA